MNHIRCAGVALIAWFTDAALSRAQQMPPCISADTILRALVREALERHPALRQREEAVRAAGARIRPAGTLPDPMVELGVMDLTLPRVALRESDLTQLGISASQ